MSTESTQQQGVPPLSRRHLFYGVGGTALTAALIGCGGSNAPISSTTASSNRNVDILNFALNLEYLEAEFYTYATTGQGIETQGVPISGQNGKGGTAVAGKTSGGVKAVFDTPALAAVASQLAYDERTHVIDLRNTITSLGGQPVARPNINLAALAGQGVDISTTAGFLLAARVFEDTGVSAYAGAAPYITVPSLLLAAAKILGTEAYHSGNIRLQVAQHNLTSPAIDSYDNPPPPTGTNYFDVDNQNSLAYIRTPSQVLRVVYAATTAASVPTGGGFFPNGVNANLTSLAALG